MLGPLCTLVQPLAEALQLAAKLVGVPPTGYGDQNGAPSGCSCSCPPTVPYEAVVGPVLVQPTAGAAGAFR